MTSVADTRLLLALEFPASEQDGVKITNMVEKETAKRMLAPSIVLAEFIEHAGARIGEEAAKTRIRLLEDRGMKSVPIDKEVALVAGSLLLSHRNVPIADALIASFVKMGLGECVITDDPHFKALGIKTKWL